MIINVIHCILVIPHVMVVWQAYQVFVIDNGKRVVISIGDGSFLVGFLWRLDH